MNLQEIFSKIEKSSSIAHLTQHINELKYQSEIISIDKKYPRFPFKINSSDITQLMNERVLNSDHTINTDKISAHSALTKLLFSIAWKNGDLHKIQHIIDGITGANSSESKQNLIFKQYGKYLSTDDEPIVDQHVLRAFACHMENNKIEQYRKKAIFRNSDEVLVKKYSNWFKDQLARIPVNERSEFGRLVDRILFITGKRLKVGDD